MNKISLGVVGAGRIATQHLKVIRNINEFKLAGITSRTRTKAEELSKKFKILKVFDSPEQLLSHLKIDAILILVSADQIFSVTKKIIKYRIPFFVEKPPGLGAKETRILSGLTKRYRVLNMVGFNRRYYSIFQKGIKFINRKGKLLGISIEGHERFWKISKNIKKKTRDSWIFANSTHTIDLLRFFGGELKNISSYKKKLKEKNGDQFVASMKFKNGILGNYISHWYSPGGWTIKLFGESITVEFKPLEKGFRIDKKFKKHKIFPNQEDVVYKPGFYNQMKAFAKMVKTKNLEWPGQNLEQAHRTMILAKKLSRN